MKRTGGVDAVKLGTSLAVLTVLVSVVAARAEEPEPVEDAFVELANDPFFDDDFDDDANALGDPLEEANRRVFAGNRVVDRYLFDPLTLAYAKVLPGPVKRGVRNVFSNLDSPKVAVNDVLQLEWKDASVAVSRFVMNSTMGIAGIFDVAERLGLAKHRSDFGQTLALAGTPRGPYLMLPLFGPSSLRDAVGGVVDLAISPATYFLAPGMLFSYGGGMGLAKREENYQALNALESSSIDFYSALRSAYEQHRAGEVWSRREHRREDAGESASEAPR